MRKLFTLSLLALMSLCAMAQDVTLTFTGRDADSRYVELNRVVVTNQTKGWSETLLWPDTTLTMQNADLVDNGGLLLSQNNPNPFNGTTEVRLAAVEAGEVSLIITNVNGRAATMNTLSLQSGVHSFRVTLAQRGTYLMTATQNGRTSSIKMMCNGEGSVDRIEYQSFVEELDLVSQKSPENPFSIGDKMEYVGYVTIDGTEKKIQLIEQAPADFKTVTMQYVETPVVYVRNVKNNLSLNTAEDFRVALSLSPFSLNQFEDGYSFVIGDKTASSPEELQQIYSELGSTEMYVRIATKRHKTAENTVDGEPDENANVHTFDQAIQLCQIAAALDIPINPEIMCAYTYMDMDRIQAPRFEEYPEIYALQNGKDWTELSLDEICTVLEAYGEFVAEEVLNTGCTVKNWNLGNEANFGFAGVGMGAKTAVDRRLAKASAMKRYTASIFAKRYLRKHVWCYEAKTLAAVKKGVLKAYEKLGIDTSDVKFSTHIATVVFTPKCSAKFFEFMAENGYAMETAGISYYPSAPAMSPNKKKLLTKTITKINEKCGVPVFIGEFSYPSGKMDGPFASWKKKVKGYAHDQQGQADIYEDVIEWGKENGMAGIRYWAPDYEGWYTMSMFEFSNKVGTAKTILKNHKEIVE